jgi:hypothetical protein
MPTAAAPAIEEDEPYRPMSADLPRAIDPTPAEDPVPARGPSLFERMTAIGRGGAKVKETRKDLFGEDGKKDAGEDPMDIPAFFKQQVND